MKMDSDDLIVVVFIVCVTLMVSVFGVALHLESRSKIQLQLAIVESGVCPDTRTGTP